MAGPSASPAADRARHAGTLITAALDERRNRAPDFAAENDALHRLAQALTSAGGAVLQTLADMALNLCGADSAGIGLLERGADGTAVLRWVALSGHGTALADTIATVEDSPSGIALELGAAQLFSFPQRHFARLERVIPKAVEELVVPIPGEPEPWGTLWVISHDGHHRFDTEHRRILTSLANFTCAALTITRAKADAEARAAQAETARSALALSEARKDDFIALLGHELRNPIAPIDSALTAARKLSTGRPAVLSALDIAERQTRLLKRLVSDLLDASRIKHGKLSVRPSYGLLQDIVADAVTAVKADTSNGQKRLCVRVPTYPVRVHADLARLTQVVANLLSNAVKYTQPDGNIALVVEAPDVSIVSTHNASPRDAVITVTDNGAGISASMLPHVFEMFAQSPSARKRAEGGLGIGLAVVKYLVSAHNGTITIASGGEAQGTEVAVRLPIVCEGTTEPTVTTMLRAAPVRILLVDDNADTTEALATLLELEGHEVRRAEGGPEALAIVESFTPDVALIDITMPGMDGPELARLLKQRAQCSQTKLVAVTGHTDIASRFLSDERVFDFYLTKPLSLDDLADIFLCS